MGENCTLLWTIMKMKKMRTLDTRSINTFSTSTRMFRAPKASFLSLLLKNYCCGLKLWNKIVPNFDNRDCDGDEREQYRDSFECYQLLGDQVCFKKEFKDFRKTVVTLKPELKICLQWGLNDQGKTDCDSNFEWYRIERNGAQNNITIISIFIKACLALHVPWSLSQ